MDRRTLLKALVASAFASRAAYAAPPANMKGIEELQKNWKSFVPAGAAVPSPGEPLKLSKDEWRKRLPADAFRVLRSEEHTSELQSRLHLVCRLLLEKKKNNQLTDPIH